MPSDKIISKIKPVLLKYGVTRSDIFGSYARGDYNDQSDIDILVEPPSNMSLFGLIDLQEELKSQLGRDVDIVTYDSVNKYIKKYVYQNTQQII